MSKEQKESLRGMNGLISKAAEAVEFSEKVVLKLMEWGAGLNALDKDEIMKVLTFAEQSEAEYAQLKSDAELLLSNELLNEQKEQLQKLVDASNRVLASAQAAKAHVYALPGIASYEEKAGKPGQLEPDIIITLEQATHNYKQAFGTLSGFESSFSSGSGQEIKANLLKHLFHSWAGAHYILASDYEQHGKTSIELAGNDVDLLIQGMEIWDSAISHYKRITQVADRAARFGVQLDDRFLTIAEQGVSHISRTGAELATSIGLSLSD